MIGLWYRIDVVDVARFDHRVFAHIAEQRELAPFAVRDWAISAAQQDVGLENQRGIFKYGNQPKAGSSVFGRDEGRGTV